MDNKKIGELIAKLRKEKGLTQEQLGELVGVGYGAVSKWERGINTPDKSIINELSEILGISSTELLNGEIKEEIINELSELEESTETTETDETKESETFTKKPNKLSKAIIIIIPIIILIVATILIYNHNKTYAYDLLSTSKEYHVEGNAIFKGDKTSIVVNKIKFKNDELNSTIIKNYEYDIHSNGITIYRQGYIYLINQLETEQKMWEFLMNFRINYNEKTDISRQELIDNNLIITLKFLDKDNNEFTKDIEIKLQKVKEYEK